MKNRYIEYDKAIYVLCGIAQDRFYNLYFNIIKLDDFINDKIDGNLKLVAINNINEITDRDILENIKILYE